MENASKNDTFRPNYHFVTGRLAEHSLRENLAEISDTGNFDYTVGVMPITVAALITPKWLKRHLVVPDCTTKVILPGYCHAGLHEIQSWVHVPVECGPTDLRNLSEFFSLSSKKTSLDQYNIEIIAEINHAPNLSISELQQRAVDMSERGANIIDLGCNPESRWTRVDDAVAALTDMGLQVSIDTLDPYEAAQACKAGARLVLSVNSHNRHSACDWGTEVVVIPDTPTDLASMHDTIDLLADRGVPYRIDPILEPIGFGFASSLQRYMQTRRLYPDDKMMMGIGNLSELSDVDSAGVNFLLLGICEELKIHSVLTTEVINWARSSVTECDIARRLMYHAITDRVPPKNISSDLISLRDPRLVSHTDKSLELLSLQIKDNNYRLFAQDGLIHLIAANLHLRGKDPFELFENLLQRPDCKNIDAYHAFYLGFEMAKAVTALTLGKQYEQDQALAWGHLTQEENMHRLQRPKNSRRTP